MMPNTRKTLFPAHMEERGTMVLVRSHEEGTYINLCCVLCRQPLTLHETWLAFPADANGAEGKWIHRTCSNGRIVELFGQPRATMMRGRDALRSMAARLQGSDGLGGRDL
jgi:hypothetical protein